MEPQASAVVTFGIPLLAVSTVALLTVAIARVQPAGRKHAMVFGVGALLWLGLSAALAKSGVLTRVDGTPPPFALIAVPTLLLPVLVALSPIGKALGSQASLAWLVGFQGFRFPLELVMHQAAVEGTMPPQMTYTGANFDIVTGITALALGLWLAYGQPPTWIVQAWNAMGTVLLLTIITVAIVSLPRFHLFGADPAHLNTWVAYFPFVWLPAGLVASAWLGHLLLWRRLLQRA